MFQNLMKSSKVDLQFIFSHLSTEMGFVLDPQFTSCKRRRKSKVGCACAVAIPERILTERQRDQFQGLKCNLRKCLKHSFLTII